MSMRSLFSGVTQALGRRDWTVRHTLPDGSQIATLSPEFVDELLRVLSSQSPLELSDPLVINNRTNGPALAINNLGESIQHEGIAIFNQSGQSVKLGIGLGNEGIIANGVVADPAYELDPEIVAKKKADIGGGASTTTPTPNTTSEIPFCVPGPGRRVGPIYNGIGSGYGQGKSGSGIPFDYGRYAGVFNGLEAGLLHLPYITEVPEAGDDCCLLITDTKTGNYSAEPGDLVICNGTLTVELPASPPTDSVIGVYKISSNITTVTVDRNGNTISMVASDDTFTTAGAYREYHYRGGDWIKRAAIGS